MSGPYAVQALPGILFRGFPLLAEARLHQLRRPSGQIAIMHQDLVERNAGSPRSASCTRSTTAWYCRGGGPAARHLYRLDDAPDLGGVISGGLFVLPSLFILIALTWDLLAFGNVPLVAGLFYGIKPAVTAIVLFAAYRIGSRALKNAVLWTISFAAFVAIFAFDVPFPYIVLGAGIVGYLGGRIRSGKVLHRRPRGCREGLRIGLNRRCHAHAPARAVPLVTFCPRSCGVSRSLGRSPRCARCAIWVGERPRANGLVLHQGCAVHLRRRVRGAALRLPGRCGALPLANCYTDD